MMVDGECVIVTPDRIRRHGVIAKLADGREVFSWDGKPLIEFYPIETSFDATEMKMKVTQKYRLYT